MMPILSLLHKMRIPQNRAGAPLDLPCRHRFLHHSCRGKHQEGVFHLFEQVTLILVDRQNIVGFLSAIYRQWNAEIQRHR